MAVVVHSRLVSRSWGAITPTVSLSNGTSMMYGSLVAEGLQWQSSGILLKGGCSPAVQYITDCYQLQLGSNTTAQLDPGSSTPRQRIEFETPKQGDGTSWHYTWRSYYQSNDLGSTTFFHIMQIFSAAEANPAFFLDILKQGVSFKDVQAGRVVATTSVATILATPLQHSLQVTYGPTGSIKYSITNSRTGASILQYSEPLGSVGAGGN
ncbi:hypothetical protein FIBSPDRAFT_848533 [Athelia psychrophila]|uniref:Uncharacterized protein n=1 Tax=Athelia psychrophila TaxID=1759441 RepID=A0A166UYZ8_9AGAM|nr:hypothetical protein FIBSPDRAFT_848533 [Fibularhizoctonia sp. CBS 109695]